MSDHDKSSKTEQPTGKRLDDARRKGNVPRSQEVTTIVTILAAAAALYFGGGFMLSVLKQSSRELFASLNPAQVTEAGVYSLMLKTFATLALVLLPFLLILCCVVLAANACQGGIVMAGERLAIDPARLNPVNGIKRVFSGESAFNVLKSLLKTVIVAYMAYRTMRGELDEIVSLTGDVQGIASFICSISFKLVFQICGVMIVLAVLDAVHVRWQHRSNLRMTKQEVKDEYRETEGDPKVKGRIKQLHFERARRRFARVVPQADVIITNPTHYAVALKYDRDKMWAPVVLAKGADHLALKIREIARQSGVTIVENRFLARELYAKVKEGEEIPEALYTAVAEVLAYVYGLKGRV